MRRFNSTGLCVPWKHYMVDVSGRVAQMRKMVEAGDYFCVNRGRQYGKTTLLAALERELADDYAVADLDFQALSREDFRTEGAFASAFARELLARRDFGALDLPTDAGRALEALRDESSGEARLAGLFSALLSWNRQSERPVVLIIDEVDSATNNQVFLDFLAQLRLQYLMREKRPGHPAFQSVILAGVTDVRHLKAKIRPDEDAKTNSPWNIAAAFDVDMSFSADEVAVMLREYDADHGTGMSADAVAREICDWSGGYPFLVSRLCQLMDERDLPWTPAGVNEAARMLLKDGTVSLFESLMGKVESQPALAAQLRSSLMEGTEMFLSPYDETQRLLAMYGFITEREGKATIANRLFETLLYDYFLAQERRGTARDGSTESRGRFVRDGRLNMREVLEGFRRTYTEVYGPLEAGGRFAEKDGRELFLLYLKPIINGTGNYYVEAQTRDQTRMDVVVDYAGERFVVELKIWRGPRYNEEGEVQVVGYLEHFGLDVGYMLSFNFSKRKEPGMRRVAVGDKVLWEETV